MFRGEPPVFVTPVPGGYQVSLIRPQPSCAEVMDAWGASAGPGLTYDPVTREMSVEIDPSSINFEIRPNGLFYLPGASVPDCDEVADCMADNVDTNFLTYNPVTRKYSVKISANAGNQVLVGTDGGLYATSTGTPTVPVWTTLPGANIVAPYVQHGTEPLRYRVMPDGMVQWHGRLSRSGTLDDAVMVNLPAAIQPSSIFANAEVMASVLPASATSSTSWAIRVGFTTLDLIGIGSLVDSVTEIHFDNLNYWTTN